VRCFTAGDEGQARCGIADEADCDGKGVIMLGAGKKGGVPRWVADFALAFILFWAVALSFDAGQSRAYAVYLPELAKEAIMPDSAASRPASLRTDQSSQSIQRAQTSPEQARMLLSLAFAALAAINLGFWRHLRRVYASPRRSVWRRG
jgi:hypothetical protein